MKVIPRNPTNPTRRRLLASALAAATIGGPAIAAIAKPKRRILIVCSYDRSYIWSQSTQAGVNAAFLKVGYLEDANQAQRLVSSDAVESKRAVIRKLWMDTKKRNTRAEIAATTDRVMKELRAFKPDLVLLGDDNAANYIGNQLLDSKLPVVFWGINGLPLKYGLIESLDAPGRNITGVWQSGYHKESLDLLKRLVPKARTFAILSCDSESSRPNIKMIEQLSKNGVLPLQLVETVVTNSFEEFKARSIALSKKVDAFFLLNHDTLRDRDGNHVDFLIVGRWYLQNIRIPEAPHEDQFVYEGMLLTANDSGHNQGFMAAEMALLILENGVSPSRMAVRTPDRGPYMVNGQRAKALGIRLEDHLYLIDEVIERSVALERR